MANSSSIIYCNVMECAFCYTGAYEGEAQDVILSYWTFEASEGDNTSLLIPPLLVNGKGDYCVAPIFHGV